MESSTDSRPYACSRRVVNLIRFLPHYRVPFYIELDRLMRRSGLRLQVVYGAREANVAEDYEWAVSSPNRSVSLGGRELIWQPALSVVRGADLVIVEQASRLLINYFLAARNALGWNKLAYWGHGKNFQATRANLLAEAIKKRLSVNARWWFAYNGLTRTIVESLGFPPQRITEVQNAVDTAHLQRLANDVTEERKRALLAELGLSGANVGIYCGRMYTEKRIDFLLEAAALIREEVHDFELILVGSGPHQHLASAAAEQHDWIRHVGAKFDEEKVELFALSKVFLMPGLVGLAVLDAFALQTPMITTSYPHHSPEIDYLESGQNGLMTADDVGAYASGVVGLLQDPERLEVLRANAFEASKRYTIEKMASNFHQGVLSALEAA